MASTTNANVQTRVITAAYAVADFPSESGLMASGVVRIEPNPPFKNAGGYTYNVPKFYEYTTADVVPATDDTEDTRNAVTTYQDIGIVTFRETGIAVKDTAKAFSGENINAEIERQIPKYWAKRTAVALYSVIKGVFGSAMATVGDFVVSTGAPFSRSCIVDIIKLDAVGDQWPKYRTWIMHSKQFAQAWNDGIVQYVNAGSFGERLLQSGEVPTIAGRQVLVDDNIQETDGTTYLAQPNAMFLGFQRDFTVEQQRMAHLGGGLDEYWPRACFMAHVYETTFGGTSTAYPTNTTLATAGSWSLSQSTDPKTSKIIKVQFAND